MNLVSRSMIVLGTWRAVLRKKMRGIGITITIVGTGHHEQSADNRRQTGKKPTPRVQELVRFCVMREEREFANI